MRTTTNHHMMSLGMGLFAGTAEALASGKIVAALVLGAIAAFGAQIGQWAWRVLHEKLTPKSVKEQREQLEKEALAKALAILSGPGSDHQHHRANDPPNGRVND